MYLLRPNPKLITRPYDPALSWKKHPIDNNFDCDSHLFALLGHYLVILPSREGFQTEEESSMRLMVMDLRDHSVQKTKIRDSIHFNDPECVCTLTKYKENQVIKVDGHKNRGLSMWLITIESFQPLSVKYEHIQGERLPIFQRHSAQFYKEILYVYGENLRTCKSEVWMFDFDRMKVKQYDAGPRSWLKSFSFEDKMYVYGEYTEKDCAVKKRAIFVLNLDPLTINKLEQTVDYMVNCDIMSPNSHIYKNYLLLLDNQKLSCWNIYNNTWSILKTSPIESAEKDLIVYEDSLLAFDMNELYLESLNLESVPFLISEKERIRSLFMNEEGSDLMFTVEKQIIYAHKDILIKKSRFFFNMFRSGMAESRQKVIEIPDWEFLIFKEFLRFLYYEEIHLKPDENLLMKLYICSDFFLENDLSQRCLDFLKDHITSNNVYTILDFARQWDLEGLRWSCKREIERNITVDNVCQVITYVNQKYDLQRLGQEIAYLDDLQWLASQAFKFIINNPLTIDQKGEHFQFYENFLKVHIGVDNFIPTLHFASAQYLANELTPAFKQVQANLKDALFNFAKENSQVLKEKKVTEQLKNPDLVDCLSWLSEREISQLEKEHQELKKENQELKKIKTPSAEKELHEENEKKPEKSSSSRKRREPIDSVDEVAPGEKPELKKTKKS